MITPAKKVETFYLLDFDRCLASTEKFQLLLERVVEKQTSIKVAEIRQARHDFIGSFDLASYVRGRLTTMHQDGEERWIRIESEFVDMALGEDLLEPGAHELLHALDSRELPYGIVTYGGDAWQRAKIAAAGLLYVPHLVTDQKEKGVLIASWQREDGYQLPQELAGDDAFARRLVFVDDKPFSFWGLPANVRGICVTPIEDAMEVDMSLLPDNVEVAHGLGEVVRLLFDSRSYL